MEINARIEGAREVSRALSQFGTQMQGRMMENALMAGARVYRDGAQRRVPVRSGRLLASIKARRNIRRDRSKLTTYVGHTKLGRHAHLVERGRQAGTAASGRTYPAMAAQPYIGPTIKQDSAAAIRKIVRNLTNAIKRSARELAGPYRNIKSSTKKLL